MAMADVRGIALPPAPGPGGGRAGGRSVGRSAGRWSTPGRRKDAQSAVIKVKGEETHEKLRAAQQP